MNAPSRYQAYQGSLQQIDFDRQSGVQKASAQMNFSVRELPDTNGHSFNPLFEPVKKDFRYSTPSNATFSNHKQQTYQPYDSSTPLQMKNQSEVPNYARKPGYNDLQKELKSGLPEPRRDIGVADTLIAAKNTYPPSAKSPV